MTFISHSRKPNHRGKPDHTINDCATNNWLCKKQTSALFGTKRKTYLTRPK